MNNNSSPKKIYKTYPADFFISFKQHGYLSLINYLLDKKPIEYEKIKKLFTIIDIPFENLLFFYSHLGQIRTIINNLHNMSEEDFNAHLNLAPDINYFSVAERFNFLSGLAFQMEEACWNEPPFLELENKIKWYLHDLYLKDLKFVQKEGLVHDFNIYVPPNCSICELQLMRSTLEYVLTEMRYVEQKHRLSNIEFVNRTKKIADWLENELQKTDPILHKMFLKEDYLALSPKYNPNANQNLWWENWENIQKLMEENG